MNMRRSEDCVSCCRLCLGNTEPMKLIFEDAAKCKKIVEDVAVWLNVKINVDDRISRSICAKCTEKLKEWNQMRKLVGMNQLKLLHRMNLTQNSRNQLMDESFHIKDELIDESMDMDITSNAANVSLPNGVRIKKEKIDEANEELPPPLSPHPSSDSHPPLRESARNIQKNKANQQPPAPPPNIVNSPDKARHCRICDKLFSSVNNRLRHERNIHHVSDMNKNNKNQTSLLAEIATKRKQYFDQLRQEEEDSREEAEKNKNSNNNNKNDDEDVEVIEISPVEPETVVIEASSEENEKTQFAAELQLLRKDAVCNLTKVEQFYVEKYKGLLTSLKSLRCVCHNTTFQKRKEVVHHLRYFFGIPMYTCFNCMISYPSRATYYKRNTKRCKLELENMTKVSQIRRNSPQKLRAYHNFVCRECNFIFFLMDDVREHIDREHIKESGPFQCLVCSSISSNLERHKVHLYSDCLVAHYCDICSESFPTKESFEDHSKNAHDPMDITPKQKLYIGLLKDRELTSSTEPVEMPEVSDSSDDDDQETVAVNPVKIARVKRKMQLLGKSTKFNPVKCDICGKRYSNIYNMRRHAAVHMGAKNIECEHCFEKFRTKADLNEHIADMHSFPTKKAKIDDSLVLNPSTTRTRVIKKPSQYDNASNPALFSCADCKKLFNTLVEWKEHRAEHDEYICNECGLQFNKKTELEQHRSTHLNLKLYRDSKGSSYKSTVVDKNLKNTNSVPVPAPRCEICDKTFANVKSLQQHKALHQQMPTLTPQNGTVEDKKVILKRNSVNTTVSTPVKEYQCPYCPIVFYNYKRMWNHKRYTHERPTKPKPPVLTEPNVIKSAKAGGDVKRTIIKPLAVAYPRKCDLCEKVLASYSSYWKHQRRHLRKQFAAAGNVPAIGPPKIKWMAKVKVEPQDGDEKLHSCKICNKVFGSKKSRHLHEKLHKPSRKYDRSGKFVKNLTCDICNITCLGMAELKKHKNNEHFVGANAKKLGLGSPPPTPTGGATMTPQNANDPARIQCEYCETTFSSKGALRKHMNNKHSSENEQANKVYCKHCGQGFRATHLLDLHVQKDHPSHASKDKKYACDQCDKICDTPMSLIVHKGWHKRTSLGESETNVPAPPVSQFKCTSCSEKFSNDTDLQLHILKAHREIETTIHSATSFSCEKCRFVFKSSVEFEHHMRLHQTVGNQKCLSCNQCDKKFSRSDSLNSHVRKVHGGSTPAAPVEHLVVEPLLPVHFGSKGASTPGTPKEYPCQYCEKVFDRSQSYALHKKMHERELRERNSLQKGGKDDIVVNPNLGKKNAWFYSCTACKVQFDSTKKLRQHMQKKHP